MLIKHAFLLPFILFFIQVFHAGLSLIFSVAQQVPYWGLVDENEIIYTTNRDHRYNYRPFGIFEEGIDRFLDGITTLILTIIVYMKYEHLNLIIDIDHGTRTLKIFNIYALICGFIFTGIFYVDGMFYSSLIMSLHDTLFHLYWLVGSFYFVFQLASAYLVRSTLDAKVIRIFLAGLFLLAVFLLNLITLYRKSDRPVDMLAFLRDDPEYFSYSGLSCSWFTVFFVLLTLSYSREFSRMNFYALELSDREGNETQ